MTDKEIILSKTTGGFDVFLHYFGDIINSKKLFLNKYRSDRHPSCTLRLQNDRYYMHDFGSTEWSGDCFSIVGKIYNLNPVMQFGEILRRIDSDLHLFALNNENRKSNYVPLLPHYKHIQNNKPPKYSAILKELTITELSYWAKYGIDKKTLERYNVKSVLRCCFEKNGKNYQVLSTEKESVFAYVFDKGIKLYRPKTLSGSRFLYGGQLPKPYIFGIEQLPDKGKVLFITAGEKDVLSLAAHGFDAICFNSETAKVSEDVIQKLLLRFDSIVFLYDVDETGIRESQLRVNELRQKNLNSVYRYQLPIRGTKEEKDISDYFRIGKTAENLESQVNKIITG